MWIVTNKGFLSIVKDNRVPGNFVIRARNKESYDGFFEPERIYKTPKRDYAYRVFGKIDEVKRLINYVASKIDYDNFKNSIVEDDLHTMAAKIWTASYLFQQGREPKVQPITKPNNTMNNVGWGGRNRYQEYAESKKISLSAPTTFTLDF